MRVLMGEVIDVTADLTTKQLTIKQKFAVLWESLIADSKILGKRKKQDAEKLLKERNAKIDKLRDGLLASLEFHLTQNKTLEEFNEEVAVLQLAIDRTNLDVIDEVLASHEFNSYEFEFVDLDADLVNSFGSIVPIVIAFKQRGLN